jgi:hypothetical protein
MTSSEFSMTESSNKSELSEIFSSVFPESLKINDASLA